MLPPLLCPLGVEPQLLANMEKALVLKKRTYGVDVRAPCCAMFGRQAQLIDRVLGSRIQT